MNVQATATEYYLQITLGTEGEPNPDYTSFKFGESAEITIGSAGFGSDEREVKVSFGAIGSHDAETAARRANVYATAAKLAAELEPFKEQNLEQLAVLINGRVEPFITSLTEGAPFARPRPNTR